MARGNSCRQRLRSRTAAQVAAAKIERAAVRGPRDTATLEALTRFHLNTVRVEERNGFSKNDLRRRFERNGPRNDPRYQRLVSKDYSRFQND